ncbi:MAG: hypothetical protein HY436_00625, partial [Candidatus Liptonbacteria bacterium]|nr:hypothetical protein [Candidatus Liptonbacteria bacterium]
MMRTIVPLMLITAALFLGAPAAHAQDAPPLRVTEEQLITLLKRLIELLARQANLLQAELETRRAALALPAAAPDARAILFLVCRYESLEGTGTAQTTRGTGVLIHPEGFILTARHIVDPSWTLEAYPNDPHYAFYETLRTSYRLDSCAAAEPSRD